MLILFNIYFNFVKYNKSFVYLNKTSICIIFGTRPEIIKLAPLITLFKKHNDIFNTITIFTGQHEDISEDFLSLFNIKPSYRLKVMVKNQSLGYLTSILIFKITKTLTSINPSLVIVQGDTTSSMAGALSSFYLNIPIAHIEAGLRTYKIDSPFPEELNRQIISKISTFHFAVTIFNLKNLKQECLSSSNIYLVGNTITDSIKYILSNKRNDINNYKGYKNIILFTIHRRENLKYFASILKTIVRIIMENNDTQIIYPIHPNPNIKEAIYQVIPKHIYYMMRNEYSIKEKEYIHLNRLSLIKQLSYTEMINVINISTIIATDSGGIQEEAVSLGKILLILRDSTERYEAVYYGAAILVGTDSNNIYSNITSIIQNTKFKKVEKAQNIYGYGNTSEKIINILMKNIPFHLKYTSSKCNSMNIRYDIVYVLSIWKRLNYSWQIEMLLKQRYKNFYNILIVIFQNGDHIYFDYSQYSNNKQNIHIEYIHSVIETGYFARFIIPLLCNIKESSYFFIIDDDIRWGNYYFNNMIELVDKGFLATRNGRLIDKEGNYKAILFDELKNMPILYNEHIEFDFGGHIWGGKTEWLKVLWKHPPPFYDTCEDIWISVVIHTYLGIKTATPKCNNITSSTVGEICACDDYSNKHESGMVGNRSNNDAYYKLFRKIHIKKIVEMFNYTPIYSNLSSSNDLRLLYYTSKFNFTIINDMKLCKSWIG